MSAFKEVGNPFEDGSADTLELDNKDIVSAAVVDTVKNITHIGQRQYDEFVKERLQEKCKAVTEWFFKLWVFGTAEQIKTNWSFVSTEKRLCFLFKTVYCLPV